MFLPFFPFSTPSWANDFQIFSNLTFKIGLWHSGKNLQPHTLVCPGYFVERPSTSVSKKQNTTTTINTITSITTPRYVGHKSFGFPHLHRFILANLGEVLTTNGFGLWLMKWVCNIYDLCNSGRCGEVLLNRQREFFVKLENECLLQVLEFFLLRKFFFLSKFPRSDCILDQRACCCSCTKPTNQRTVWRPPKFWKPWQNEPQTSWRSDVSSHCSPGVSSSGEHLVPFLNIQLAVVYKWRLRELRSNCCNKKDHCKNNIEFPCQVKIWNMLHPRTLTCSPKNWLQ